MILVDTSIWIDHLRVGDPALGTLLRDGDVLAHPWVTGELALGHLTQRDEIPGLLRNLPQATAAADARCSPSSTSGSYTVSASDTSARTC